ncbi:MAG: sulfurtransferase [Salaquimonas sp.]|nr:sulfurtransferase [Salaquimonas sp.]
MSEPRPFTVAPDELQARLGEPNLRIVDGSWYLPVQGRDGRAEFDAGRIPGAVYFDLDAISDQASPLPHMLATPGAFAAAIGAMGISETNDIVVYDGPGLFSSARVWWNFHVMGAKSVRVLDGGFDLWKAQGRPVENGAPKPHEPAVFNTEFDSGRVRSIADIRANLKLGEQLILDARPYGRFTGEEPEPRPGLTSGHIPGAQSMPAHIFSVDGRLKDIAELKEMFAANALKPGRHAITSCGSGVTAAIISLALETIGHSENSLYDGSWAEWGQAENAPVATWE